MINSKNMYHYAFVLGLVMIASFFGNKFKQAFEPNDEYDLIKKYLLNESPLYGFNKPKIWVHSKNEINARKWKSFYSRNTTDLNQPYKHLTIMSIINHCGSDFNVCLIDDETFSKLIPTWDIQLSTIAEPMRSHLRELGMLQLVYFYGGMVVPNSFLCLKNLIGLYNDGINIKASEGQAVGASEDGIVAYVGNELKGYGNLVIIKHSGGWISAYAHLKNSLVARGQKINKGQKIGNVGNSGKVKFPQLYFGLRRGRDAVNPESYL